MKKMSRGVVLLISMVLLLNACSFGKGKRRFAAGNIATIRALDNTDCNWKIVTLDGSANCTCSDFSHWRDTCNDCFTNGGDLDGDGNIDAECMYNFPPECNHEPPCPEADLCDLYPNSPSCNDFNGTCEYYNKIAELQELLDKGEGNADAISSDLEKYRKLAEEECSDASQFNINTLSSTICSKQDRSVKEIFKKSGYFPIVLGAIKESGVNVEPDISLYPDPKKPYARDEADLLAIETPPIFWRINADDENPDLKCLNRYCDNSGKTDYIPDKMVFERCLSKFSSIDADSIFSDNFEEKTILSSTVCSFTTIKEYKDNLDKGDIPFRRLQDSHNSIVRCADKTACDPNSSMPVSCAEDIMTKFTITPSTKGSGDYPAIPMVIVAVNILKPEAYSSYSAILKNDAINSLKQLNGTLDNSQIDGTDGQYYNRRRASIDEKQFFIPFVPGYCNIPDSLKVLHKIASSSGASVDGNKDYQKYATSIASQSNAEDNKHFQTDDYRDEAVKNYNTNDKTGTRVILDSFPVPEFTLPGLTFALTEDKRKVIHGGFGMKTLKDSLSNEDFVNNCINCHLPSVHTLYINGDDDGSKDGIELYLNGTTIAGSHAKKSGYILSAIGFKLRTLDDSLFTESSVADELTINTVSSYLDAQPYTHPRMSYMEIMAHLGAENDTNSYTWNDYRNGYNGSVENGEAQKFSSIYTYLNPFLGSSCCSGTHLQNNFDGQLSPVRVGEEITETFQRNFKLDHEGVIEFDLRDVYCMKKIHDYLKDIYGANYTGSNYRGAVVVSGKNSGLKALDSSPIDRDLIINQIGGVGYVPTGFYLMTNINSHIIADGDKWNKFDEKIGVTVEPQPGLVALGQWSAYKQMREQEFDDGSIAQKYTTCYSYYGTGGLNAQHEVYNRSEYEESLKCIKD